MRPNPSTRHRPQTPGIGATPAKHPSRLLSKAAQAVALLCLLAYAFLLAHKAVIDVGALLAANPQDFWVAFGRHLIRNLGGG